MEGTSEVHPLPQGTSSYVQDICKKLPGSNIHCGSYPQPQSQPPSILTGPQRTRAASRTPEGVSKCSEGHHASAWPRAPAGLPGQHWPPARVICRATRHRSENKKMPASHSASRRPCQAVRAAYHQSPLLPTEGRSRRCHMTSSREIQNHRK